MMITTTATRRATLGHHVFPVGHHTLGTERGRAGETAGGWRREPRKGRRQALQARRDGETVPRGPGEG